MGQTTRGIRYPEPTDRVADGAAAMRTLAEDVEGLLMPSNQPRILTGIDNVYMDASGYFYIYHYAGVTPLVCHFQHAANGGQPGTPYGAGDYTADYFRGRMTGVSAAVYVNIAWTVFY